MFSYLKQKFMISFIKLKGCRQRVSCTFATSSILFPTETNYLLFLQYILQLLFFNPFSHRSVNHHHDNH